MYNEMNWQSGEEYGASNCPAYDSSSTLGTIEMPRMQHYQELQQQQHQLAWSGPETATAEIPLLNDDHEKAILSDLCNQSVGESTPLSTFSYISEYICSNNIDIWPGETTVGAGCGVSSSATTGSSGEPNPDDQRSYTSSSSCVHQQLFFRCKRVLESIIARNEQILELLRQKQHQQAACRPTRQ